MSSVTDDGQPGATAVKQPRRVLGHVRKYAVWLLFAVLIGLVVRRLIRVDWGMVRESLATLG